MKATLIAVCMVLMVGTAQASTNDVIQACARKDTGVLRISGIGGCRRIEYPVQWNQQGPAGTDGTNGTNTGLHLVTGTVVSSESDPQPELKTIECGSKVYAASAWVSRNDDWGTETYALAVDIHETSVEMNLMPWVAYPVPVTIAWTLTCGAI